MCSVHSIRRLCENLGLQPARQLQKLREAPWAVVHEMYSTAADGKSYEMAMLQLEHVPMWGSRLKWAWQPVATDDDSAPPAFSTS